MAGVDVLCPAAAVMEFKPDGGRPGYSSANRHRISGPRALRAETAAKLSPPPLKFPRCKLGAERVRMTAFDSDDSRRIFPMQMRCGNRATNAQGDRWRRGLPIPGGTRIDGLFA